MIQLFKPQMSEAAIAAANEVLRSGWIGLGPRTAGFEKRFSEYVGSRYAIALNSATSALHLAVVGSGIKPGDEVLTVSLTFVSTNHAICYAGALPVFVDVDSGTLNMDLKMAEKLITKKTKAIIVVHYGGNPCNIPELYGLAERHGLKVIEDAAHACGASYNGKKIGSFAGITCFSFHAVKNLPLGDGGMITTNDQEVYDRLMKLRWMGIDRSTFQRLAGGYQWEYDVSEIGFKYHMNDISAAMGIEHLKELDSWNDRRRCIAAIYRRELASLCERGLLSIVETTDNAVSANHLFVIRVKKRNAVIDQLKERGISVGVHYRPNHHYDVYKAARRGKLAETERAYAEIISLPMHLGLTDEDIVKVSGAIREIVDKKASGAIGTGKT